MAHLDMFNTCEGIENELSKHPVLPSQPLYRQYYMSNGNYLRKKKITYEYTH